MRLLTLLMTTFLLGCTKVPTPSIWPLGIVSQGHQDVVITCSGPSAPIMVKSEYCGGSWSLTNGAVVIFVKDEAVIGVGWDTPDLSSGGQVFADPSDITGRSTDVPKWWVTLCKQDGRFSLIPTKTSD